MGVLEQSKRAAEREVTAPSGIVFRVRGLTSVEYGAALSGVPGLLSSGEKSDTQMDKFVSMQAKVCEVGTISGAFEGETDDAIGSRAADWTPGDLATVFMEIQRASGLIGPDVETARRAL